MRHLRKLKPPTPQQVLVYSVITLASALVVRAIYLVIT